MLNIISRGNGYPIVFLHGALVDHTMWTFQVTKLESMFRVLIVDLPSHGHSEDFVKYYSIEELATIIYNEVLSVEDSCILCGHSLGGMVCQYLSATRPEKIAGLILVESSYGTRNNFLEKILSIMTELYLSCVSAKSIINLSAKYYGGVSRQTKDYLFHAMGMYPIQAIRKVMLAALNYNGREFLSKIQCKTLILIAEYNTRTHYQASRMLAEINNSELIMIPNAHHMVNMDNPVFFNDVIIKFIKLLF
jgi:3-oxoadipate enol-lactonase